ncbi:MAG: imelysin family protein [Amaricoccus sp.]|uniref:iron uptake system protein EfeO n=1 Tax=Amaricoccus sp. TaxID=1872485 RepID=UPI0039E6CBD9
MAGPRPMSRNRASLAIGAAALLVVAGLGAFWFAARTSTPEPLDGAIMVTVNDDTCDPADLTVPAGKSTFHIHNASQRPLEWEILDGVMVVAERENITPGLNATLTERLKAGTYDITCGLLSNPRGKLTVVATAASEAAKAAPELRSFIGPLSEYQVYLNRRAGELIEATATLSQAVAAGDLDGARAAWLDARQPWRQMAPVIGRLGDVVNSMDPLADYLEKREADPGFTGFHRIEYGLWAQGSTDGLAPVAATLAAEASTLKDRLKQVKLAPGDLAANAAALAGRVVDQATASQAPYSHSDLAEFSADLDGIAKSARLVQPLVADAAPQSAAALDTALDGARATLDGFKVDGAFPPYDSVDADGRKRIADAFTKVADTAGALNPAIGLE